MVARFPVGVRGERPCRGQPGLSGHQLAEDVAGGEAAFPCSVDVAADVEAVPGDVVAGKPAGDLLPGLERADAAPAEVVSRPDRGAGREAQHVGLSAAAELKHLASRTLLLSS